MDQSGKDWVDKHLLEKFNDRVMISKSGKVCGVYTFMIDGTKGMHTEQYLHKSYLRYNDLAERIENFNGPQFIKEHYKKIPDMNIEEFNRGRAHIQAYKIKNGIPLDTPLCFHESVLDDLAQGEIAKPVMER